MTRAASSRTALALAAVALSGLPVGVAAPARAATDWDCNVGTLADTERLKDAPRRTRNDVHDRLQVAAAHELATGRGSKVVVIDSGVQPLPGIDRRGLWSLPGASATGLLSGHGTIVAGLIAGRDGMAPAATIYDVRVFDNEGADTSQGQKPLTSQGLADGIRAVIAAHPREQFDVVNISLAMQADDPELRRAVADLVALDVVVVASAGNQPTDQAEGFEGTPGSDATVYPADYPGVVAVSAAPPGDEDPRTYVTPNADTDVAAPTFGAISVNVNGQRCVVPEVATSWAAAEVSGLLALLREHHPRETPAQLVARLQATTEGAGASLSDGSAVVNPWTGAGVVSAHDALARELEPQPQGTVDRSRPEIDRDAQAPPAPARVDLFGSSRALLLWSGLLAGGLLALAFMLRPLLRRR